MGRAASGLEAELSGLERRLWTNDPEIYRDTLAEEALLSFPETGIIGREVAVDAIRQENAEGRHWAEVEFADVRVMQPADEAAVLMYRVRARWNHEAQATNAMASSLYVRRNGDWKLAFHQQTPIEA